MKKTNQITIIALAAILAACGGGGGDDANTNNGSGGGNQGTENPVNPTPPGDNTNYPTDIKPDSYTDSHHSDIYKALNYYRTTCGFSSLAQSNILDTAAQGHAKYSQVNSVIGHNQNNTLPSFTGRTIQDRLLNAGYSIKNAGEIVGGWVGGTSVPQNSSNGIEYPSNAPTGKALLNRLMSSVYHLKNATGEWNDVGIGYSASTDKSNAPGYTSYFSATAINFGNAAGSSAPVYNGKKVRTFPCDTIEGVSPIFTEETPNPFPSIDFNLNPMGTPIYIQSGRDEEISISSAEIIDLNTGVAIPFSQLTAIVDPQKKLTASEAFIIPKKPLTSNGSYRVKINGTDGSETMKLDFVFKTGTQN